MTSNGAKAELPHGRLARICAVLAAGAGGIALLGWGWELPFLTSLGSDKIPMAPTTAVLFILYGAATAARALRPLHRGTLWLGTVVHGAGSLVAALLLLLSSQGIHPDLEHLGFAAKGRLGEAPIGHMSPMTALGFLIASLAFLGSLPPVSNRRWRAVLAWFAAFLLLLGSCVLLLSYLYGAPLLYGSAFIPPAATTCMAFAALGVALLALAAPQAWRRSSRIEPARRFAAVLTLVFLLVAGGIIAAGYFYSRAYDAKYSAAMKHGLSSISELKASELAQYRQERLGDGSTFFGNSAFTALVRRVLGSSADPAAQAQLRMWLRGYQEAYRYDRISLLDADGAERMSYPEATTPIASGVARRAMEALRSKQMVFQDFYRNEHDQRVYLSVLVPILDDVSRHGTGALVLRVDPQDYLYPLLSRWPTSSETAETMLVRRDGNDALILNERRFMKEPPLTLRVPLTRPDTLAVKAVLGREGIAQGIDYRGASVVADIRAVPDSPWFLIVRIDASEVFAPLRERMWMTILVIGALLAGAAAGIAAALRRQQARFYRELYESERDRAWLRDVVARSLNEIYVFDPDSLRFTFANTGACDNLGYSPEEMASLTPLDIKPQLTEEAFRTMLDTLRRDERGVSILESVHRRKDGSEYPVEVYLQHVETGSGPVFLALINDITERKRAESALRESEDRYRDLVEHSQDLICTHDLQGWILSANEAAVKLTGYSLDALLRMNLRDLLAPDVSEQVGAYLTEIEARGEASGTMRIRTAGGELRDWAYNNTLRKDGTGGPIVRGMAHDVTERKKAEERLLLQGAALDAAASAVVITDREGVIQWVNRAFTWLTGYRSDEAIGKHPGELVKSGVHDRAFYEHMWKTILGGQTWRGQIVNRRKDGTLYTDETTITPVRHERGAISHFIATKENITQRLQIEAQLRELQKMEAVGRLAGGIAHDFNNQIFVINGYCDLLLGEAAGEPAFLKPLAEIKKAAQHSAGLTAQLLAFSRKQVLQPKVLDLPAELTSIETILQRLIGEDVRLVLVRGEAVGHVRVDPNQLQQVVMNLAVNARDAMPNGGRLTIETKDVELDETYAKTQIDAQPGPYVLLAVSDTGHGMDRETLDHLFEPFFTTKEPGKGTGLGLATVQGIVKQSGGHVAVLSEPGVGTTIEVYLPRVDAPVETSEHHLTEESVGGSETILLAEDEAALRELLRRVLTERGYHVLPAADGNEALQLAASCGGPIHLLLTDVVMPGMGGLQLAERVQSAYPETRVLYMSGHTENVLVHDAVRRSAVVFLPKPCPTDLLLRKVRDVLDTPSRAVLLGKRILVVDDSESDRMLQAHLLRKAGCAVLEASRGEEALELLARETVDAVLTDVRMPGMDGFALTEAIRSHSPLQKVPVFILSGGLTADDEAHARAVGATACLSKGRTDQQALLDTLARLL